MENQELSPKRKIKWQIIIPVVIAVILAGVLLGFDYWNKKKIEERGAGNKDNLPEYYSRPKPVSPAENPRRAEPLDEKKGYGCAGPQHLEPEILKPADAVWEIKKNGTAATVSLGKYRIYAPINEVYDITKLWLYFSSEKLGREEDGLYGLEAAYVSKIRLVVNDFEKEIKLGGDNYSFIELDYPLGDMYPYDKSVVLDFEILIDLQCKNVQKGNCLGNDGKSLAFIDDAEVISQLRLFAVGCQEFTKDMQIPAKFNYD